MRASPSCWHGRRDVRCPRSAGRSWTTARRRCDTTRGASIVQQRGRRPGRQRGTNGGRWTRRVPSQLDGHVLRLVDVGHSDTDGTAVVHIPSLGLVVAGDVLYDRVHPFLVESQDGGRAAWRAAIALVADLQPKPPAKPAPPTRNSSANSWHCSSMAPRPAPESSTRNLSPPPPPWPPSSSTTPSPRQPGNDRGKQVVRLVDPVMRGLRPHTRDHLRHLLVAISHRTPPCSECCDDQFNRPSCSQSTFGLRSNVFPFRDQLPPGTA